MWSSLKARWRIEILPVDEEERNSDSPGEEGRNSLDSGRASLDESSVDSLEPKSFLASSSPSVPPNFVELDTSAIRSSKSQNESEDFDCARSN